MSIEIKEYLDADDKSPYGKWFNDLDARAAAKITVAREKSGRGLLGDIKSVGDGVSERRVDYGPGYRIYFGSESDGRDIKVVILLCGGSKKRQDDDIANAKEYWKDYKWRKRQGKE